MQANLNNDKKFLSVEERIKAFHNRYPNYCGFALHNGRLYTTWCIGAMYKKGNGYYGSYPYSVRQRILALFPDCKNIIDLFSGTIGGG